MITYRPFRNADPPALTRLWNACFEGRGVVHPLRTDQFESLVCAKPYFDSQGLILAVDEGEVVGFAHAGFGPDEPQRTLDRGMGVIAMLAVRPSHRRRGIGTKLLHQAEEYLRRQGASVLYAGEMNPLTPFYLGLYGGSEMPGILDSDASAHQLLLGNGYRCCECSVVLRRPLHDRPATVDRRFHMLNRRFELEIIDNPMPSTWWMACQLSPFPVTRYELREKSGGRSVAGMMAWDMTTFGQMRGQNISGIIDVQVVPELRRQGLAKFMLSRALRHLREQSIDLVEVQTMQYNQPACSLYQALGFIQEDSGKVFRREPMDG